MPPRRESDSRDRLINAGIEAFRLRGYDATSVDEICTAAGLSKGAFFHQFASKESLALVCLDAWADRIRGLIASVQKAGTLDPQARLMSLLDAFIGVLSPRDHGTASCLAGTLVQEVSETNAAIREAVRDGFAELQAAIAGFIRDAAGGRAVEADELARLWITTIQGGLILVKASRDPTVLPESLRHVREYIRSRVTGAPA